jgi:hypothetical protein
MQFNWEELDLITFVKKLINMRIFLQIYDVIPIKKIHLFIFISRVKISYIS